ncbi:short-chain dehydrogenase/reductase SDR [Ruminiclostridium papyrosolvens DSM 2782]|uniref:Short-chain dehydrogenase/reductase SDR n=1 Tax=Ruminiclostridium papyrosolvens DSM 2782 TaxID=588581 RepID=F1T8M4_9FIRM|nr:SDR family NAD(P)-dependent oxidoreductase [Ruminiclostridium papyrosolvens]EGD48856.1 short-chain dehydrogenase/reductase SDR [Ruminiclostridium papyrosolvens DSM 2782]WES35342.1 SDR family NAD(P)-dependent oxidoreductase [Ruminiclostridium papyrosolvens DSM 2782]
MDINGKKIILTGASSGIGKEVLKELSKYDADIIAVARNVNNIPKFSNRIITYSCDVSNKENIDMLFEYATKTFGKVDIFIANAGFAYCEDIQEADWEHIEKIYLTNVVSPIYSLEKMKVMNEGRKYSVLITCSAVSKVALPGYSLYCSTKAAVHSFGDVYRYEENDKGHLSLVYPIATDTNFFKNAGNKAPVPWPVQSTDKVAKAMVKGILKDKRFIYPSKLFTVLNVLNRFFPFLYHFYALRNSSKFKKWLGAEYQ